MAIKQFYRFECDRCGSYYCTENGKLPREWNVVLFKTMNTYDDGITTDFNLCADCGLAFGHAVKDFLNSSGKECGGQ